MEILNSVICLFKFCSSLITVLQMFFALCSTSKILGKMKLNDGIKVLI